MQEPRRVIKNACVITMDPSLGTLDRADILVEGEQIRDIAADLAVADCEVIDGSGMIAIPGFVDTHRHPWMTQLRGAAADWTLFGYTAGVLLGCRSFFRPQDVHIATYAGALEALDAGVTTMVAYSDCTLSPDHADEMIRALEESGTRAIFCYGMLGDGRTEPDGPLDLTGAIPSPEWHFDDVRRVRKSRLSSDDALVTLGLAMNEVEMLPLEFGRREIELGREVGAARISCHVAMGAMSQGVGYVGQLADAGLLGPDLLFAHGNGLSKEELEQIADAGAAIAVTPESELATGCGYPVTGRAMDCGARVSLGVDAVLACRGDLFTQMRLALQTERGLRHHALEQQGLAPREARPSPREMLELATLGGACAAGLDTKVGSLTPGKQADIALLRCDGLSLRPVRDPVNAVVLQANAGDVDTVLVAGRPVKRAGQLVDIDLPAILSSLEDSRTYLETATSELDQGRLRELAASLFPLEPA
jgi:5-methylthioadenosine/S-adenosylhomocysteine deaminase